jgi:hypothetical protein
MIAEARERVAAGLAAALPPGTRVVAYAVALDDLTMPVVVLAATTLDATDTACPGVKVTVEAFVVSHKIEPGEADAVLDPLADACLTAPIVGVAFRTARRLSYLNTHPAWLLTWEVIA